MSITINSKGFPELREDHIDLATISKVAEGRPGNDFHDTKGKFTFTPAGVQVLRGGDLLKLLSESGKARLFKFSQMAKPNQLIATLVNGKVQVTLLTDGRRLASFPLSVDKKTTQQGKGNKDQAGQAGAPQGSVRDLIVDAARDLTLTGDALNAFVQKRGEAAGLSPGDIASLERQIRDQQINDLVDYLHQKMRQALKNETIKDSIRISVGRGYEKKVFSALDKDGAMQVLTRLQARGWLESQVQEIVTDTLPKRLKEELNVVHKESETARDKASSKSD